MKPDICHFINKLMTGIIVLRFVSIFITVGKIFGSDNTFYAFFTHFFQNFI